MARPTVVRYSIVGLAMAINMLCYTDRVCIAVAGPSIRSELGLSQAQLGLVFSIFFLAYAVAQAPWGCWRINSDRAVSSRPRSSAGPGLPR